MSTGVAEGSHGAQRRDATEAGTASSRQAHDGPGAAIAEAPPTGDGEGSDDDDEEAADEASTSATLRARADPTKAGVPAAATAHEAEGEVAFQAASTLTPTSRRKRASKRASGGGGGGGALASVMQKFHRRRSTSVGSAGGGDGDRGQHRQPQHHRDKKRNSSSIGDDSSSDGGGGGGGDGKDDNDRGGSRLGGDAHRPPSADAGQPATSAAGATTDAPSETPVRRPASLQRLVGGLGLGLGRGGGGGGTAAPAAAPSPSSPRLASWSSSSSSSKAAANAATRLVEGDYADFLAAEERKQRDAAMQQQQQQQQRQQQQPPPRAAKAATATTARQAPTTPKGRSLHGASHATPRAGGAVGTQRPARPTSTPRARVAAAAHPHRAEAPPLETTKTFPGDLATRASPSPSPPPPRSSPALAGHLGRQRSPPTSPPPAPASTPWHAAAHVVMPAVCGSGSDSSDSSDGGGGSGDDGEGEDDDSGGEMDAGRARKRKRRAPRDGDGGEGGAAARVATAVESERRRGVGWAGHLARPPASTDGGGWRGDTGALAPLDGAKAGYLAPPTRARYDAELLPDASVRSLKSWGLDSSHSSVSVPASSSSSSAGGAASTTLNVPLLELEELELERFLKNFGRHTREVRGATVSDFTRTRMPRWEDFVFDRRDEEARAAARGQRVTVLTHVDRGLKVLADADGVKPPERAWYAPDEVRLDDIVPASSAVPAAAAAAAATANTASGTPSAANKKKERRQQQQQESTSRRDKPTATSTDDEAITRDAPPHKSMEQRRDPPEQTGSGGGGGGGIRRRRLPLVSRRSGEVSTSAAGKEGPRAAVGAAAAATADDAESWEVVEKRDADASAAATVADGADDADAAPGSEDATRVDGVAFVIAYVFALLERYAAEELDHNPDQAYRESKIRSHVERLYLLAPFWENLLEGLQRLYRWEDQRRTAVAAMVYFSLWLADLIPTAFLLMLIYYILEMRFFPPSEKKLHEQVRRRMARGVEADRLAERLRRRSRLDLLEVYKRWVDKYGRASQMLAGDVADFHEKIKSLILWRNPTATWRSVALLSLAAGFVTFAPSRVVCKSTFFLAGFTFFLLFPLQSHYPRYRRPLSPVWWALWGTPTDAQHAITTLRRRLEAQLEPGAGVDVDVAGAAGKKGAQSSQKQKQQQQRRRQQQRQQQQQQCDVESMATLLAAHPGVSRAGGGAGSRQPLSAAEGIAAATIKKRAAAAAAAAAGAAATTTTTTSAAQAGGSSAEAGASAEDGDPTATASAMAAKSSLLHASKRGLLRLEDAVVTRRGDVVRKPRKLGSFFCQHHGVPGHVHVTTRHVYFVALHRVRRERSHKTARTALEDVVGLVKTKSMRLLVWSSSGLEIVRRNRPALVLANMHNRDECFNLLLAVGSDGLWSKV